MCGPHSVVYIALLHRLVFDCRQDFRYVYLAHVLEPQTSLILCYLVAGTGLSYSETHADYVTNDTHTAQDSNRFIRRFLQRYPEYAKNDFYIIGTLLIAASTSLNQLSPMDFKPTTFHAF